MISETAAKRLLAHLRKLPGSPADAWGWHQLGKVLMQRCADEEHAEAAIESALHHGNGFCPKIPDLIAACERTEALRADPSRECRTCGGTGMLVGQFLVSVPVNAATIWEPLSIDQEFRLYEKGFRETPSQMIRAAAVLCPGCRSAARQVPQDVLEDWQQRQSPSTLVNLAEAARRNSFREIVI